MTRRTSAAPIAACNAAPAPLATHTPTSIGVIGASAESCHNVAVGEASRMASSAGRPHATAAAIAKPAAGNSGDALPGGSASSSPSLEAAT
jgi:hypothetical protein